MYKTIRTAIMKILVEYQKRHASDKLLLITDDENTTCAQIVSVFQHTNRKKFMRTVTVTITVDEEEVK